MRGVVAPGAGEDALLDSRDEEKEPSSVPLTEELKRSRRAVDSAPDSDSSDESSAAPAVVIWVVRGPIVPKLRMVAAAGGGAPAREAAPSLDRGDVEPADEEPDE